MCGGGLRFGFSILCEGVSPEVSGAKGSDDMTSRISFKRLLKGDSHEDIVAENASN